MKNHNYPHTISGMYEIENFQWNIHRMKMKIDVVEVINNWDDYDETSKQEISISLNTTSKFSYLTKISYLRT